MKKTDEQLSQQAKDAFDKSVDGLDAATLSRLNRGRQAALAELAHPPARLWLAWLPATGVAAAVLLLTFTLRSPVDVDAISAPAMDLDILLGEESIEMIEDLEFYSWLDTQEFEGDGDVG
jgi:hypothetical protein